MPGNVTLRLVGCAFLGALVAAVGTGVHRMSPPSGLLLAYLTVLTAAVLVRAWARAAGMVVLALAVLATVLAMAFVRPGGDVVVAADAVGYAWLAGAAVVVLAGLLPRRLFSDSPLGAASHDPQA